MVRLLFFFCFFYGFRIFFWPFTAILIKGAHRRGEPEERGDREPEAEGHDHRAGGAGQADPPAGGPRGGHQDQDRRCLHIGQVLQGRITGL